MRRLRDGGQGLRGGMAFRGPLAWFLLLQMLLGEARMIPGTLSLPPLRLEDGLDDPSASPQEKPLTGMPEISRGPQPEGSMVPLDSVAFTPSHSVSPMTLSQERFPTWIPTTTGEVSESWSDAENWPGPRGMGP